MGIADDSIQSFSIQEHWMLDLKRSLEALFSQVAFVANGPYHLLRVNSTVFLHLLSPRTSLQASDALQLQEIYQIQGIAVYQLWQDLWLSRPQQVLARIKSLCGLNDKLYARKTQPVLLDAKVAKGFFDRHHLMGHTNAKSFLGLHCQGELLALAGFGKPIQMKTKGAHYYSAELIRFATLSGVTLIGGLGKIIKSFIQGNPINDLMTYADRDWSAGAGYEKLGFKLSETTAPQTIYLDLKTNVRYFEHRLPQLIKEKLNEVPDRQAFLSNEGFIKIFNTGNLKYYLYA